MSAAPDVWIPSPRGRTIDMLRPMPADVDFLDIADALSLANRYAGNSRVPVSIALHTLIACDAAAEPDKPHVLLHDAHEARIGDITTPAVRALAEVALDLAPTSGGLVERALRELKRRHDVAIHAAAGLPMPTQAQRERIHVADLIALQTERRDFLCRGTRPWAAHIEAFRPLARVYRLRPAPDIAAELYARFQRHLPTLASRHTIAV